MALVEDHDVIETLAAPSDSNLTDFDAELE